MASVQTLATGYCCLLPSKITLIRKKLDLVLMGYRLKNLQPQWSRPGRIFSQGLRLLGSNYQLEDEI